MIHPLWRMLCIGAILWGIAAGAAGADPAAAGKATRVELPAWNEPAGVEATAFSLGADAQAYQIFGGATVLRWFADELLPACFERTVEIQEASEGARLSWVFTGPRAGLTVTVSGRRVQVQHRYYDSPAFEEGQAKASRHSEWRAPAKVFECDTVPRAITVRADAQLGMTVLVNDKPVVHQKWLQDLSRHQLQVEGSARGRMLRPASQEATVRVDPAGRHQTILGFGGIAAPMAYAQLSAEGKRQWWRLLAEYNLLVQREYPMGRRLNAAMDNWDRLADACPHYYADNFPNGEVSDFEYIKTLRGMGGQVWFEFWALPQAVYSGKSVDAAKYADAMVRYCRASRERAGAPPDIVGVQNEVNHDAGTFHQMTLALRKALDEAGFNGVKIHMADRPVLREGLKTMRDFQANAEAWKAVDFVASHMYDFQGMFTRPDEYDALLRDWKKSSGNKPTLSTELCVNSSDYQADSYRLALQMGQLYHKNLVIADASAIAYCWLLLNVEQPSYGTTRSLFVPDMSAGGLPVASSHQLRVFGAYSRYARQGMVRVDTSCANQDLLVSAFADDGGRRTLVALNRSLAPVKLRVEWSGVTFARIEQTSPYQPNLAATAAEPVTVAPGGIVTLTTLQPASDPR